MKKLILILALIVSAVNTSAQSEIPADSLHRTPLMNIKQFGGFLLDMGLMDTSVPTIFKPDLKVPNLTKDYNQIFRMNTDAIYKQGFSRFFSPSPYSFGNVWEAPFSPEYMQMGSFKLKNGMRINTYGDYNAEGWRVPNRNALPWERNNFRGAFELKSANENFGIRIEVQQRRNEL